LHLLISLVLLLTSLAIPYTCSFMLAALPVMVFTVDTVKHKVHVQFEISFTHVHIYISFLFSSLNQYQNIYEIVRIFLQVQVYLCLWCGL
jgi:hypothetical protein